MPARSSAARTTIPPRSAAENPARLPASLPIGVRAPLTMTDPATASSKVWLTRLVSGYPGADSHRPRRDRLPRPRGEGGVLRDDVRPHRRAPRDERGAGRARGDAARRARLVRPAPPADAARLPGRQVPREE